MDETAVLPKSDVFDVVQLVLDLPMAPLESQQAGCLGYRGRETRDAIPHLTLGEPVFLPGPGGGDDSRGPGPPPPRPPPPRGGRRRARGGGAPRPPAAPPALFFLPPPPPALAGTRAH